MCKSDPERHRVGETDGTSGFRNTEKDGVTDVSVKRDEQGTT